VQISELGVVQVVQISGLDKGPMAMQDLWTMVSFS